MVTSAVNSSVKVQTWRKQGTLICPQTVFSKKLALSFNKLFIKGCCNNRLSRHCCHAVGSLVVCFFCVIVFARKVFGPSYEVAANLVTSVSQRTIVCVCSCQLDGINVLEIITRFFNKLDCLIKSDLIHKLIPHRIVEINCSGIITVFIKLHHIDQFQTIVGTPGNTISITVIFCKLIQLIGKTNHHCFSRCKGFYWFPAL